MTLTTTKIKVIVIDSHNQEVRYEEIYDNVESIQKITEDTFTLGLSLHNRDHLYVDDNALLKKPVDFFIINKRQFAGNGVIVGIDSEGNALDCKSRISDIKRNVIFWRNI